MFNTLNLAVYHYGANNPLKYVDPDGRTIRDWYARNREGLMKVIGGAAIVALGYLIAGGGTAGGAAIAAGTAGAGAPAGVAVASAGVAAGKAIAVAGSGIVTEGLALMATGATGNSPKSNEGESRPHGNDEHNSAIEQRANQVRKQGATNIRKNQVQVDANGNRVGDNRPDLQYDLDGRHYNVEFDHNAANSARHGAQIRANDPNAAVELNLLPKN